MRPIPQTIETATELRRHQPEMDVLSDLQATADKVQALIPDILGMSIAWLDQGVVFTLVASDEEVAVLDAVQYLSGGPCVYGVEREHGLAVEGAELFDEEQWRLFSRAAAAKAVRSTLTFPLTEAGEVVGSANLYGGSDHAFEGQHDQLARVLGASVTEVVRNADLSFSTRQEAEATPEALRTQHVIDIATGMVAAATGLDIEAAAQRLAAAALRAGISRWQLAAALVELREREQ